MNRRVLGLLFLTAILTGVGLFIYSAFFGGFHDTLDQGSVLVCVNNLSGQTIKSAIIIHETGNVHTENIRNGESVKLLFKSGGENAYKLVATLQNDSSLTSQEMYTEGGYTTIETVYSNQIKSEYQKY